MKKFILMLTLIFSVVLSSNAQVVGNKALDNMYVGVNVGATTPLDFNKMFPVNPMASVRVGKNITPVFGLAVEGSALFGRYNYGNGFDSWPSNTFVKGTNVALLGTFNFNNAFAGYNGTPRPFEVSAVAGLGWLHYFSSQDDINAVNDMSAKAGLNLAFNLGKEKAWQVYAEPMVLWNLTEGQMVAPKFNKYHAQLGLQIGVNYKFMTSNGTHNFVKVRAYDQAEVDALNKQIANLKNQLANKKNVVPPTPGPKPGAFVKKTVGQANVWFAYGKAELTDAAKAELDKIAKGTKVAVNGYCSPEGSKEFNQTLSEARANAVADYLKARGVEVTEVAGKGIASADLNRVVIVTVK